MCIVLGAGLEPAQPQWSQDFKSCVSTIPPSERTGKQLKKFQITYANFNTKFRGQR